MTTDWLRRIRGLLASPFPSHYRVSRTMRGFQDSINCLCFDADGNHLAAGADDGRVIIFDITGREDTEAGDTDCPAILTFIRAVPVSSILWHEDTVYVGYVNGDLLQYVVDLTKVSTGSHLWVFDILLNT